MGPWRGYIHSGPLQALTPYVATCITQRHLLPAGAEFDTVMCELEEPVRTQYEQAAEMWNNLRREFLYAQELADAANMAAGMEKKRNTMLWRAYWAAHQRFFRSMCMAAKVCRQYLPTCQAVQHGLLCSICITCCQHEFPRSRPCCD